jgi:AraC-like DNA-binding protein
MSKTVRQYDRYLPVSERVRQWGLYVTGAGFGEVPAGSPYPRRGHPQSHEFAWQRGRVLHEYQVVYIRAGSGEFESAASGARPVAAGSTIVLFPGVWHRYRPRPAVGWEEYWVGFAGESAQQLQQRGFLTPDEPLWDTGPDELLLHAFTTLLDRMRAEPPAFEQLLAASVWEILATAQSAARLRQGGDRLHQRIRLARSILESHTGGPPQIAGIAARLGLSVSRFQHAFKEATGLSPYQYHLQLKIQRAEQLLRGGDLSIKELARLLEFRTVYHFSTLFKRKTGLAPSVYRRQTAAAGRR